MQAGSQPSGEPTIGTVAARMTPVPQTNGDGTPKIMKPMPARMPWTTGTTISAWSAPFTVRSRCSKI